MRWTEELIESLRAMIARNMSGGQIAGELGMTRNAVVGKAFRLRLQLNGGLGGGTKESRKPKPKRKTPAEFAAAPVPGPAPSSRFVGLMELRKGACRWPLERKGETLYCGAPQHDPNSRNNNYCGWHACIAFNRRRAA